MFFESVLCAEFQENFLSEVTQCPGYTTMPAPTELPTTAQGPQTDVHSSQAPVQLQSTKQPQAKTGTDIDVIYIFSRLDWTVVLLVSLKCNENRNTGITLVSLSKMFVVIASLHPGVNGYL